MAASSPSAGSPDIRALFERAYGSAPSIIARAPGRVEFIGNHTDYNGGAVLGAAIDRFVWVADGNQDVSRADDNASFYRRATVNNKLHD